MAKAKTTRWDPLRAPIGDPEDARGFEVLIAEYVEALKVKHFSPGTQESVRRGLRLFGRYCEERGLTRPGEVTREVVEAYQRHVFYLKKQDGQSLSFGTQHGRMVQVRGFFGWLARRRYLLFNPAADLQLPKPPISLPVDAFSVEEVEQILAAVDVSKPMGLRDRVILELFYSSGLRRMEVVNLEVYDVDLNRRVVIVRQGKGRKDRVVPLGERAAAWIGKYLNEVRPGLQVDPQEQALFLSGTGQRFDGGSLVNRVRKIIKRSGVRLRRGACHLFRHSMATLMLEGGADIRYIQEMLGHANLETTEIYTRVSIQKLQAIHAATHPGAKLALTQALSAELAEEIAAEDKRP